jgi:isopentenyl phosphate kinase
MTVVLKLGGSLITDKHRPETVATEPLEAAVEAVADAAPDDLVVVHGGGSFGHHHADRWDVTTERGTHDPQGVVEIHGAMKRLNRQVVGSLQDAGVPAVPVHPLSVGARAADGSLTMPLASVRTLLGEGFVPVLHGDVVGHASEGVTVLSGDEIVVSVASELDADRVGLCSTVPGVLDGGGDVVQEIRSFDEVAAALGGSDATDVSGGMAAKVQALLDLEEPAYVFGRDGLEPFLAGDHAGTRIHRR